MTIVQKPENGNKVIIEQLVDKFTYYIKLTDGSNKKRDSELDIVKILITVSQNYDACRSYPEISKIVYGLDNDNLQLLNAFLGIASNDGADNNFSALLDEHKEFSILGQERLNNLHHLEKHIKLSCYQREYMDKISNDAKKQAKESLEQANLAKSKIDKAYSEFTTILGIFTAITFATFGGLQLLGHVFGSIKNVTHVSIGSTIMLGSIYLIGTYLILVALLTGIAKLGDKKYIVSFPMRDALLGAFIAMFLFGFAYSNYHFLLNFIDKFWYRNHCVNFLLILLVFLFCVFLPGILDMIIYRKISNKTKGNSLKDE